METKRCKQCGELLPISNFRPYYTGSGNYNVCSKCEKINSRFKYLTRKGDKATAADKSELAKIEQLYEYQRLAGLKPPRRRKDLQLAIETFDELLRKYKEVSSSVPEELQRWLTVELTEEPEYYDAIYEQLNRKYRPLLRVDSETFVQVFDETYTETLHKILERFNDYEDKYYN